MHLSLSVVRAVDMPSHFFIFCHARLSGKPPAQQNLYDFSDIMDCDWNTVDGICSEYDSHRDQKAGSLISLVIHDKQRKETPPEQQDAIQLNTMYIHITVHDRSYDNLACPKPPSRA